MYTRKLIGATALVDFPELKLSRVMSKIDTGALSGALHATDIREVADKKGRKVLEFNPFGNPENRTRKSDFSQRRVRSSNGQVEIRYLIDTTVVIEGQEYPISISLTDRSQMKKAVLIGRYFLHDNSFVVDVRQRATYGSKGKK